MLDLDICTVQLTTTEDGFFGVQVDGLGGPGAGSDAVELMHPYGFMSRPADPDAAGRGCKVLRFTQGSQQFSYLADDPREHDWLPVLRKGESVHYGPAHNFVRCHEDGSISLSVTHDGTADGYAVFARLSPEITEASGRKRQAFELETPWGRITFGSNGFHVRHSSGARIDLGALGGLPPPLDAMASYATITAAVASIQASAVAQGTDGGATHTAALGALTTLITAMAAAIDGKTGATSAMTAAAAAAIPAISQLGAVV